MPAETRPLRRDRLLLQHPVGMPLDLHEVQVDDHAQVGRAEAAGSHRGLPDLTLLHLAVAEHHVDAVGRSAPAPGERHAEPDRHALAERPAGGLDERAEALRDVDLERRPIHAVGVQPHALDQPAFGKRCMEQRRVVRRRQQEPVTVGPLGLRGAQPHLGKEQAREQVGGAEALLNVALAEHADHAHDIAPHRVRVPGDGSRIGHEGVEFGEDHDVGVPVEGGGAVVPRTMSSSSMKTCSGASRRAPPPRRMFAARSPSS